MAKISNETKLVVALFNEKVGQGKTRLRQTETNTELLRGIVQGQIRGLDEAQEILFQILRDLER
mgnify:CR=1 FL=1